MRLHLMKRFNDGTNVLLAARRVVSVCGALGTLLVFIGTTQTRAQDLVWREIGNQPAAWYRSPAAGELADLVRARQNPDGGWPKRENERLQRNPIPGSPRRPGTSTASTLSDKNTLSEIVFLSRRFQATAFPPDAEAALRGIDFLIKAQLDCGGWATSEQPRQPHQRNLAFNDGVTVETLRLLRNVTRKAPPYQFLPPELIQRAADAMDRGVACLLRTQIVVGGVRTGWCAQYDPDTLQPAWGRPYEPPGLSGSDTVGVIRFLMGDDAPSPLVVESIEAGIAWLQTVAQVGVRVDQVPSLEYPERRDLIVIPDPKAKPIWSRFYEIGTNRPIFSGREQTIRYRLAEIPFERRSAYSYYGFWPERLLAVEYPAWQERIYPSRPNGGPFIRSAAFLK